LSAPYFEVFFSFFFSFFSSLSFLSFSGVVYQTFASFYLFFFLAPHSLPFLTLPLEKILQFLLSSSQIVLFPKKQKF